MADVSMRDALAFIAANAELFSGAIGKDGIDVDALESLAVRGDALRVIERKTNLSEEGREEFADLLFSLAADVDGVVNSTGTSGDRRISVTTPVGKLTVVLSD